MQGAGGQGAGCRAEGAGVQGDKVQGRCCRTVEGAPTAPVRRVMLLRAPPDRTSAVPAGCDQTTPAHGMFTHELCLGRPISCVQEYFEVKLW